MCRWWKRCLPFVLVTGAAAFGGCSKADVSGLVDKVKQTASAGTEQVRQAVSEQVGGAATQVQEQLKLAGTVELTLDSPLTAQACYARLIGQAPRRANVLQLQSYRSVEQESFPAVFLQAQVQAQSPNELVGQIVSAQLFVSRQANGPVWYTPPGGPVELKVVALEERVLVAELAGGKLRSTADGSEVAVTGKFRGVME